MICPWMKVLWYFVEILDIGGVQWKSKEKVLQKKSWNIGEMLSKKIVDM